MADKKQLVAYPLVDELQYRQKIDSDQLNRMFRSIEESILRALLRGTEAQTILNRLNLAVEGSSSSIATQVAKIAGYENFINTMFATAFGQVNTFGDYRVNHDRVGGIVTMPFGVNKRYSKIPRYDSDQDGIADTVSPVVKIYVDSILRSVDNEVYNILNRRNDSFWIEQMTPGNHTIEIQLPPSLNKKFNYLELIPIPAFSFNITKLEYYDLHSTLQEIKGIESNKSNWPQILHLSPKEFNNTIKITIDIPGSSNKAVGFTNVDIALIDYQDTAQVFYMPFDNVVAGSYTTLTVRLDYFIDSNLSNHNKYIEEIKLVSDTNDTLVANLSPTNEQTLNSVTLIADTLYLKVRMKEVDMTTPIIRGCKIKRE